MSLLLDPTLDSHLADLIVEHIPLGICSINSLGVIELGNDVFCGFVGAAGSEVFVGTHAEDYGWYRDMHLGDQMHILMGGKSVDVEVLLGGDQETGKVVRIQGIPFRSTPDGPIERVFFLVEDVSSAKRMEADIARYVQKQREEQAKFFASIDSLSAGFLIIDTTNNILIKNQATDRILGITDLDGNVFLIGDITSIEEKLKDSFDFRAAWEQTKATGVIREEKEVAYGNKVLRLYLAPVTLSNQVIGVVALIEDITEAKIAERAKDEFFSIASHELRTPLTAIRGNTSLIQEYYQEAISSDKDLKQMVVDIHDASVRLIEIVNDFLDVSRLEQKRLTFKVEECDIIELVRSAVKDLAAIAGEKKITLAVDAASDAPPIRVRADINRTKQVLINLIGNALKFTDTGGVTVRFRPDPGQATVLVEDTGRGISATSQSLLFRKFQQAGDSLVTRDTTKGTGLGLYISKLLIEGMGGTVGLLKSEPGAGSTFFVTLPLATGN